MRNVIITLMGVAVIAGITLVICLPYLKMEFAGSANYTEQDKRAYEFYTPDLLKEMPRISDSYEFSYSNISGPQAFVYSIQFNGTTDTSKIREYLKTRGYVQQQQCRTLAECWRSPRSKDVVSLYSLAKLDLVSVSIYRRDYGE